MTNPVTAVSNDEYTIIAHAFFNPKAHDRVWWGATVKWNVKLSFPAAKGRTDCGIIQYASEMQSPGIGFSIDKACETSVEAIAEAVRILKDMGVPIQHVYKKYETLPPKEFIYSNKLV